MIYDYTVHERIIRAIAKDNIKLSYNRDNKGMTNSFNFFIAKGKDLDFLKGTGADDERMIDIEVYPFIDSNEDIYINCGCQGNGENLSYLFADLSSTDREQIIVKFAKCLCVDTEDYFTIAHCPHCNKDFITTNELKVAKCPHCECYTPNCSLCGNDKNCHTCCLNALADGLNDNARESALVEVRNIALSHNFDGEIPFYIDKTLPKICCDGEIVTGVQFYKDEEDFFAVYTQNPKENEPDLLLECHISEENPYLANRLLYLAKRFDWVVAENYLIRKELLAEVKSLSRSNGDLANGFEKQIIYLDKSSNVALRADDFDGNYGLLEMTFLSQKNNEKQKVLVTYFNYDDPREVFSSVLDYESVSYETLNGIKNALTESEKHYAFSGIAKVTINKVVVEARNEAEAQRIAKEKLEGELTFYGDPDTQFNDIEKEICLTLERVG